MTRRRIALLCLLAGALLAALVPWTLRSDRIASALARQIKQGYGIALTSSSQLTLTLLPLPQLMLSGVRLASPDGALVAEADELRSQLRILPILAGRLRLYKVQMERARITLALSERPTPTVAGSLARLRERLGTNPESRWIPRIDRFVTTDAEIVVRERAGGEVARLKRASLILNSPEPDGDVDFTASGEWNGSTVLATLSGLNLAAIRAGSASEIEGEIGSTFGRGSVKGSLTWSDHPSFTGAVRAQIGSLGRLAAWSGLAGDLVEAGREASITADGTVDLDKIQWPRATLDVGNERLDGALAVQFGARPQLRATLASEEVDLGWLGHLLDGPGAKPLGADYDVRLSASALAFGGLRLKDAAISIQSGPRGIEASLGRAGFAGGALRGRVSAGWEAEREMRVNAFGDGIDLEKALAEFGDVRGFSGTAGGQVALEATGDRSVPLARQFRGRATIQSRNGEVGGVLLGEPVRRTAPSLPAEWRAGRVRFTQAVLALDIADGRAEVAQGTIETPGTRSQLTGHVELSPPNAALRLLMQPTAAGTSRPPLLLDVAGPLRNLNLGLGEATAR
jgi:AsmA protein